MLESQRRALENPSRWFTRSDCGFALKHVVATVKEKLSGGPWSRVDPRGVAGDRGQRIDPFQGALQGGKNVVERAVVVAGDRCRNRYRVLRLTRSGARCGSRDVDVDTRTHVPSKRGAVGDAVSQTPDFHIGTGARNHGEDLPGEFSVEDSVVANWIVASSACEDPQACPAAGRGRASVRRARLK